jgi:hypothetical protein
VRCGRAGTGLIVAGRGAEMLALSAITPVISVAVLNVDVDSCVRFLVGGSDADRASERPRRSRRSGGCATVRARGVPFGEVLGEEDGPLLLLPIFLLIARPLGGLPSLLDERVRTGIGFAARRGAGTRCCGALALLVVRDGTASLF